MHLELLAVEDAVPRHGDRSIARLAALSDGGTDRAFHTALCAPCTMALLTTTIDRMWDRVWQARAEPTAAARREHRRIVAAVRAGDTQAAVAALRAHRAATFDR